MLSSHRDRPPRFWRCWLGDHDPYLTLRRTSGGTIHRPATIIWRCRRCQREVGRSTYLPPRPA